MNSYLFKVICLIGLLCIGNPIFSQEIQEITIEQSDVINQSLLETNGEQNDATLSGIQKRACVSTYTNQTISSIVTVYGCSLLTVQDVTVTSTGRLTFTAPGDITINGTFLVNAGGTLNVSYGQQPQRTINFGYDSTGNMTSQQ